MRSASPDPPCADFTLLLSLAAPLWLAGCDMLGIETASAVAARDERPRARPSGPAAATPRVGGAVLRLNKRAEKAAVFAGWRDMNDYMRENKMNAMPPEPATELAAEPAATGTGDARPAKGATSKR